MLAEGIEPTLPDAPPHLLDWLQGLGMCQRGADGPDALSAVEIQAWANGTGRRLLRWEFEALQNASRAFVSEFRTASQTAPDGQPMPRKSVGSQLKNLVKKVNGK